MCAQVRLLPQTFFKCYKNFSVIHSCYSQLTYVFSWVYQVRINNLLHLSSCNMAGHFTSIFTLAFGSWKYFSWNIRPYSTLTRVISTIYRKSQLTWIESALALLARIPLCSEMTARGRRPLTRMFEQWRGRLSVFGNLAARALSH